MALAHFEFTLAVIDGKTAQWTDAVRLQPGPFQRIVRLQTSVRRPVAEELVLSVKDKSLDNNLTF